MGYEKAEFDAIGRQLWNARKAAFERQFLTDPKLPIRSRTFLDKLKRIWFGSEHNFKRAAHEKGSLKALVYDLLNIYPPPVQPSRFHLCLRVVGELGGRFGIKTRAGIALYAGPHSIAAVNFRSAMDIHPERIRQILLRLQEIDRDVYLGAKQAYEKRYQKTLPV